MFILLREESHAEWPIHLLIGLVLVITFTEKNDVSFDMKNFISGSCRVDMSNEVDLIHFE